MMSKTGQEIIIIHILPKIARSKDNWAMSFGQVIECKERNIFLQRFSSKNFEKFPVSPLLTKLNLDESFVKLFIALCQSADISTDLLPILFVFFFQWCHFIVSFCLFISRCFLELIRLISSCW